MLSYDEGLGGMCDEINSNRMAKQTHIVLVSSKKEGKGMSQRKGNRIVSGRSCALVLPDP